jgi:hypothetical protein
VLVAGISGFRKTRVDDPFCLCSEDGQADFIVTLNPKDFRQERLKARVISQVGLEAAGQGSRTKSTTVH